MVCANIIIKIIGIVGSYLALTTNYGNISPAPQITSVGCDYSQYFYNGFGTNPCDNLITGTGIPNSTINLFTLKDLDKYHDLGPVNYGVIRVSSGIRIPIALSNGKLEVYGKIPLTGTISVDGSNYDINGFFKANIKQLYINNGYVFLHKNNNDVISFYCYYDVSYEKTTCYGNLYNSIIQIAGTIGLKTNGRIGYLIPRNSWDLLPTGNNFIRIFAGPTSFGAVNIEGTLTLWHYNYGNYNERIFKQFYPVTFRYYSAYVIFANEAGKTIILDQYLNDYNNYYYEPEINHGDYLPKPFGCVIQVTPDGTWEYQMDTSEMAVMATGTNTLIAQSVKNSYVSDVSYGKSLDFLDPKYPTSVPTSRPTSAPTVFLSVAPTRPEENFDLNYWIEGCYKKFVKLNRAPWCGTSTVCTENTNYGYAYAHRIAGYLIRYSNKICQGPNMHNFPCWTVGQVPYKWDITNYDSYNPTINLNMAEVCQVEYISWSKLLVEFPNNWDNSYLYLALSWTAKLYNSLTPSEFTSVYNSIYGNNYNGFANQLDGIFNIGKPSPSPTPRPTSPIANPTPNPTLSPMIKPTPSPTTLRPTIKPSSSLFSNPTAEPTASPTTAPTASPTTAPTASPTITPKPTTAPTTSIPTVQPTFTSKPTPSPTESVVVTKCAYWTLNNFVRELNDPAHYQSYMYFGLKLKGWETMRIITRSLSHVWYYDTNKHTLPYFSLTNNTINANIDLASTVCAGVYSNANKYIATAETWLQYIKYVYPDELNEVVSCINTRNHNRLKQVLARVGRVNFPKPTAQPSFRPN